MKSLILLLPVLTLVSCSGGSGGGGDSTPDRSIQFTSAYDPCNIAGACTNMVEISQSQAVKMIENSDYNTAPQSGTQSNLKIEKLEQLIDYDPETEELKFTDCDVAYNIERLLVKSEDRFIYIRETITNLEVKPLDKCESILQSMKKIRFAKESSLLANKESFTQNLEASLDLIFKSVDYNGKKVIRIESNSSLIMIDSAQNFFSAELMSHIRFKSDEEGFKHEVASVLNDIIYDVDTRDINLDEVDIDDRTAED